MLWFTSRLRFLYPRQNVKDPSRYVILEDPHGIGHDSAESTGEFLATYAGAPYWLN